MVLWFICAHLGNNLCQYCIAVKVCVCVLMSMYTSVQWLSITLASSCRSLQAATKTLFLAVPLMISHLHQTHRISSWAISENT